MTRDEIEKKIFGKTSQELKKELADRLAWYSTPQGKAQLAEENRKRKQEAERQAQKKVAYEDLVRRAESRGVGARVGGSSMGVLSVVRIGAPPEYNRMLIEAAGVRIR